MLGEGRQFYVFSSIIVVYCLIPQCQMNLSHFIKFLSVGSACLLDSTIRYSPNSCWLTIARKMEQLLERVNLLEALVLKRDAKIDHVAGALLYSSLLVILLMIV